MEKLIEQLVTAAVAKVPKDIREAEAATLRASMVKAWKVLDLPEDKGWAERVLRRMADQYTTFLGRKSGQKAGQR